MPLPFFRWAESGVHSSRFLRVAGRLFGSREERRFDKAYYLAKNEDVAQAGVDPLDHYLTYGRREGRAGRPEDEADAARIRRFDRAFYLDRYPDVVSTGADPLSHFIDHGLREGRLGSLVDRLEADAEGPAWTPSPDRLRLSEAGALVRAEYRLPSRVSPSPGSERAVSVLVTAHEVGPAILVDCINSILDQSLADWEIVLLCAEKQALPLGFAPEDFAALDSRIQVLKPSAGDCLAREVNSAVARANGAFLVLLEGGSELTPHALHHFVKAMRADAQVGICYGDEVFIDIDGVETGQDFKPDFSPEHLESGMYLPPCLAMPASYFREIGAYRTDIVGSELFDLALRASLSTRAIVHLPQVLSRRHVGDRTQDTPAASSLKALNDYMKASGRAGRAEPGLVDGTYRLRDALPARLPVTLMIFTDNRSVELGERGMTNLYDNFVESIAWATRTSCDCRVLAIDNGNLTLEQREYTEAIGGRVVSFDQTPDLRFNFARKANFGLRHVDTEMVVLLNDDMEILDPGWLDALMELACRPPIGAVGARLLFPDNTVQHCGVIGGILDDVGHAYHRAPADHVGYHAVTHRIRNYGAVTGACLATRMSIIREIGGFDERFEVDYNDIDLCLRIGKAGYRIAYTPFARLLHFEGRTEQRRCSRPADQQLFRSQWRDYLLNDPYYNPRLTRKGLDFTAA